jgi:hypothetical protein
MTRDQARLALIALVHDGIDVARLSEQAKREIRAAFTAILEAAALTDQLTAETERLRKQIDDCALCDQAEIERLLAFKKILEEEIERLHKTYSVEIDRLRTKLVDLGGYDVP